MILAFACGICTVSVVPDKRFQSHDTYQSEPCTEANSILTKITKKGFLCNSGSNWQLSALVRAAVLQDTRPGQREEPRDSQSPLQNEGDFSTKLVKEQGK